jgi:hypothetical protein
MNTPADFMRLDSFEFTVTSASFRFITASSSGPGWDFVFQGSALGGECEEVFPFGATLLAEAAPLPLEGDAELVGRELWLPLPLDDESGEPLFGLQVGEEHEVSSLKLRFAQRDNSRFLIEIEAVVAPSVLSHPAILQMSAWAERLPDHAYPA